MAFGYDQFRLRLRQLAEKAGSIGKFARQCGIADAQMSRYVSGEREPLISSVIKIAEGAGVSMDWLLGDEHAAVRLGKEITERTEHNLEVIAATSNSAATVNKSLSASGQQTDIDLELLGDILVMARGLGEWPKLSEKERVRRVLLAYERHSGQVRRQRTSILRLLRAG